MEYNVVRSFAKRESEKALFSGKIGEVRLFVDIAKATLDGKELPDTSVEYLLNFALQSLQDAYAGAKNMAEAEGAWAQKRDALIAGTIGTRSGGEGVDEETRVARQLVMEAVREAARKEEGVPWKKSAKKAQLDALADGELEKKLDATYEKLRAKFEPLVKQELERLAAMRATKKAAKSVESEDLGI